MVTTSTRPIHRLQVRRVYAASPDQVFRAWTTPEALKRWHAPDPMTVPLAEVDLRVGGRYRIHMREPGGKEHRVSGTYRVVEPPRRLVYTWKWEHEDAETQVTLEFKPQGTGTELILTHEGLATEESRVSHEKGWTSILERFARAHRVVSHDEWLMARTAFLAKEKEFTRLRDELSRQRRDLPWERVAKSYVFAGPRGKETLAELFEGRNQLVVYHFMFSPEWDEGCKHCSFWADSFNGMVVHLNHRDVTFVAISRAPLSKIEPFKRRMGWNFKWVSSGENDFNYDYQASFAPDQVESGAPLYNYGTISPGTTDREGISVFVKDESGVVHHTYSAYARGIDLLNTAYNYLDLVPKGRDEDHLSFTQEWVEYHDRY